MTVEVECGRCGRKYILTEESKDARVRCVKCNGVMQLVDRDEAIDNSLNDRDRGKSALLSALVILGFIALSCLLAAAIVLPGALEARRETRLIRCRRNMEQMAHALMSYTVSYDGHLPAHPDGELHSLSLLYPEYTDSPEIFRCPTMSLDDVRWFPENTSLMGRPLSYRYHPPEDEIVNSPDIPIVTEPDGMHGDPGGYSIMIDGRVEWIVLDEEHE